VLLAVVFGSSCMGTRTPTRPEPLLLEAPCVIALPPDEDAGLPAQEMIRHAIRWGAPLDDRSALDLIEGHLVRVDLATGAVTILKARFALRGPAGDPARTPLRGSPVLSNLSTVRPRIRRDATRRSGLFGPFLADIRPGFTIPASQLS
jgi:hypothetical protein